MMGLLIAAQVTDNKDPDGLGRIKVKLLGYVTPPEVWARLLTPYATIAGGQVFYPEVGDEVAVLRGAADNLEGMLILGSVHNGKQVPTYTNDDGDNITKRIRTKAGNDITFTDKAGEEAISITTKAGNTIVLNDKSDPNGLSIKNADGTVTVTMDKSGVSITVAKGQPVTVKAAGDATVQSDMNVTVKGSANVEVNAGANLTLKGAANTTLEAGAVLEVKGGAQVKVSAPMVELSGSLVKIN